MMKEAFERMLPCRQSERMRNPRIKHVACRILKIFGDDFKSKLSLIAVDSETRGIILYGLARIFQAAVVRPHENPFPRQRIDGDEFAVFA